MVLRRPKQVIRPSELTLCIWLVNVNLTFNGIIEQYLVWGRLDLNRRWVKLRGTGTGPPVAIQVLKVGGWIHGRPGTVQRDRPVSWWQGRVHWQWGRWWLDGRRTGGRRGHERGQVLLQYWHNVLEIFPLWSQLYSLEKCSFDQFRNSDHDRTYYVYKCIWRWQSSQTLIIMIFSVPCSIIQYNSRNNCFILERLLIQFSHCNFHLNENRSIEICMLFIVLVLLLFQRLFLVV